MKVLVGAFNQEKALVGAFSVIVRTTSPINHLHSTTHCPPIHWGLGTSAVWCLNNCECADTTQSLILRLLSISTPFPVENCDLNLNWYILYSNNPKTLALLNTTHAHWHCTTHKHTTELNTLSTVSIKYQSSKESYKLYEVKIIMSGQRRKCSQLLVNGDRLLCYSCNTWYKYH